MIIQVVAMDAKGFINDHQSFLFDNRSHYNIMMQYIEDILAKKENIKINIQKYEDTR